MSSSTRGRAGRDWDSGLEKKANSEKYGYYLQISRRLSHIYVLQVITLQPEWDRKVRLLRGNMLHYKEALSKGQSCPGEFS